MNFQKHLILFLVKRMSDCKNKECNCESTPIIEIDNMGREIFWEDIGRP